MPRRREIGWKDLTWDTRRMILLRGKRRIFQVKGGEIDHFVALLISGIFLPVLSRCLRSTDTCNHSGIHAQFSIAHAQWVWDLKTNPRWVELFERIWGTKELLGRLRSMIISPVNGITNIPIKLPALQYPLTGRTLVFPLDQSTKRRHGHTPISLLTSPTSSVFSP
jgi:hypothetical protein